MAIIKVDHNPTRRDYVVFAVGLAVLIAALGAWLRWYVDKPQASTAVWAAGGGLLALFAAVPVLRRPIYLGWIYLFFPIGWLMSHLAMGIIFYLVLTPTGLLRRTFGEDSMRRQLDAAADSYWVNRDGPVKPERYLRQF